jgi:AbrB family looped-hinge helix DNA binding protein
MVSTVGAEITRMSSKGQVVIPEDIRTALGLVAGSVFAVYGRKDADTILLKRIELQEPAKAFEEMANWGRKHAKQKGLDVSIKKILESQHK